MEGIQRKEEGDEDEEEEGEEEQKEETLYRLPAELCAADQKGTGENKNRELERGDNKCVHVCACVCVFERERGKVVQDKCKCSTTM